jgi:CCR4-NOT transcription complex subunit 6
LRPFFLRSSIIDHDLVVRDVQQFLSTRDTALILCGDFNSEPDSAVYEYLVSGSIEGDHYPELEVCDNPTVNGHNGNLANGNHGHHHNNHNHHAGLGVNNNVRILPPNLRNIYHDVDLASVMSTVIGAEPNFTNFTAKFKGTLDYIFYTPARLRVMAATSFPEEHDVRMSSGEGLPSACYPSDHLVRCLCRSRCSILLAFILFKLL